MKEITFSRIEFKDVNGNTKYWDLYHILFPGINPINYSNNNDVTNMINQIKPQFKKTGSFGSALAELWSIPNIPYLKEFPIQKDNWIDSLPKTISSNFNQNLNSISKKDMETFVGPFPLHPALDKNPQPKTIININPDYPPFYNNYVYIKEQSEIS